MGGIYRTELFRSSYTRVFLRIIILQYHVIDKADTEPETGIGRRGNDIPCIVRDRGEVFRIEHRGHIILAVDPEVELPPVEANPRTGSDVVLEDNGRISHILAFPQTRIITAFLGAMAGSATFSPFHKPG